MIPAFQFRLYPCCNNSIQTLETRKQDCERANKKTKNCICRIAAPACSAYFLPALKERKAFACCCGIWMRTIPRLALEGIDSKWFFFFMFFFYIALFSFYSVSVCVLAFVGIVETEGTRVKIFE